MLARRLVGARDSPAAGAGSSASGSSSGGGDAAAAVAMGPTLTVATAAGAAGAAGAAAVSVCHTSWITESWRVLLWSEPTAGSSGSGLPLPPLAGRRAVAVVAHAVSALPPDFILFLVLVLVLVLLIVLFLVVVECRFHGGRGGGRQQL